jgi:acyl CoA:acetate/3-ketoacid CoA transferase
MTMLKGKRVVAKMRISENDIGKKFFIVQEEVVAKNGTLNPKDRKVPGILVYL